MDIERRVDELARRQLGLITNEQARAIGMSEGAISWRCRRGWWEVLRPRVYVLAGVPRTWHQRVLATILSAGPDVVASHETALRLWGGRAMADAGIELASARDRQHRIEEVRTHRSVAFLALDRAMRDGVPVTSAARTVVDLSSRRTDSALGRMVDDLLRRRLLQLPSLASCTHRLAPAPGRSLTRVRRILAARWDGYDGGDSDLESKILRLLLARGLPIPRQQLRIDLGGRRCYLDLAYPEIMVAIEIDSWAYHRWRSRFDGDRARANELVVLGWRVLQVTDGMTDDEVVGPIAALLTELGHPAAS